MVNEIIRVNPMFSGTSSKMQLINIVKSRRKGLESQQAKLSQKEIKGKTRKDLRLEFVPAAPINGNNGHTSPVGSKIFSKVYSLFHRLAYPITHAIIDCLPK